MECWLTFLAEEHGSHLRFNTCFYVQGDKSMVKFEGDHNSPRPQSYYDSVSIFFYNTLRPPQLPASCSNKLHVKIGTMTNEVIFMKYHSDLIGGVRYEVFPRKSLLFLVAIFVEFVL